jgi:hypothetical protein
MRGNTGNTQTAIAEWNFTVLQTGIYRVSTTWVFGHTTSRAPYSVLTGPGGTVLATREIDQRNAPNDFTAEGSVWEDISSGVTISGTTLTVRLSGANAGFRWADAVRIERIGAAPEPEIVVLDGATSITDGTGTAAFDSTTAGTPIFKTFTIQNTGNSLLTVDAATAPAGFTVMTPVPISIAAGASANFTVRLGAITTGTFSGTLSLTTNDSDEAPFDFAVTGTVVPPVQIVDNTPANSANFSTTGTWGNFNQGRDGDMRLSTAIGNTATWTFTNLAPGTYRVSTTWVSNRNNTTQAQYQVTGGTSVVTNVLNQTATPGLNLSGDATRWVDISNSVVLTGNSLTITLTSLDAKATWADAIRIERIA